jgi:hypothetical protein
MVTKTKKKQKDSEVQYLHFKIYGKDFTRLVRDLMREGSWRKAFKMLMEGLIGITYEQAVSIMMGQNKLVGDSDTGLNMVKAGQKTKEAREYMAQLMYMYGTPISLADGKWYRPYAYINSYGENDIGGPDVHNADEVGWVGSMPSRSTRKGQSRVMSHRRAMYYAKNPVEDKCIILKWPDAPAVECAVLWHRCEPPPIWWEVPLSPQAALDTFRAGGGLLRALGSIEGSGRGFDRMDYYPDDDIDVDDEDDDSSEASAAPATSSMTAQQMMTLQAMKSMPSVDPEAIASTVDAIMGNGKELDEPPERCTKLESKHGYILPNGDFYPCGFMKHAMLAARILKHVLDRNPEDIADEEKLADNMGWIRIQTSTLMDVTHIAIPKRPTQKQQNTLWDWCQKHNEEYPKDEIDDWG